MNIKQIIGIVAGAVILGIGVYLLNSGYQSTGGTKEKIKRKITGNYSNGVRNHMKVGVTLIIVGCVVGGGLFYYFRDKRKHHQ